MSVRGWLWQRRLERDIAARDAWNAAMPEPLLLPDGTWLIPCPYCSTRGGHLGTCRFSMMHSGKVFTLRALPSTFEGWPEEWGPKPHEHRWTTVYGLDSPGTLPGAMFEACVDPGCGARRKLA